MTKINLKVSVVMVHFITLSVAYHQDSFHRSADLPPAHTRGHGRPGVCSYGRTTSCCLGWRNVNGVCQPVCKKSCVNGRCIGREKCLCSRGYKGHFCDEDVNECGSPERPCSQRCMNTHGSYRCYCEPGYTLGADGYTCNRKAACFSLHCQYGCQMETGGEMRCLCPPNLHLAADNKTCEDKDECLTGSHLCSRRAQCLNTDGSYTCRCLEGYSGNGRTCRPRKAPQSKAAMYFKYKLFKRTKAVRP
ncbi:nephronectin isoform X2 [Antennarius striatus]|uniref:nephronectin isoform X2 n=1 Tax=Antennarius striatus TaxID=241820 RepID=UPI0035B3F3D4